MKRSSRLLSSLDVRSWIGDDLSCWLEVRLRPSTLWLLFRLAVDGPLLVDSNNVSGLNWDPMLTCAMSEMKD